MKLMLDREALLSLFPNGSDAQLELRRVVTQALIEKLAIKDTKYLHAEMEKEVAEHVKKTLAAMGIRENWAGDVQVSDKLLNHVGQIVRDQFQRTINDAVSKCLTPETMGRIEENVTRRLETRLDVLVTTGLHDRVREILRVMLKGA